MTISVTQQRHKDAYNRKCDQIMLKPLKPEGEAIRAAAAAAGESLQGYCLKAVRDRMQRESK